MQYKCPVVGRRGKSSLSLKLSKNRIHKPGVIIQSHLSHKQLVALWLLLLVAHVALSQPPGEL